MPLKLTTINSDQGLSNEQVHKIVQDSKGRLWLAHPTGISRYNGSEIKIFDNSHGLDCIGLRTLEISSEEILWIGTDLGLEAMFINGEIKSWKQQPDWSYGVAETIQSFGNDIWVGSSYGLLHFIDDPKNDILKLVSKEELGLVRFLTKGKNNDLLLATVKHGLLTRSNGKSVPYIDHPLLTGGKVFCMHYTIDGYLLVGTSEGLLVINKEKEVIHHYKEDHNRNKVNAIAILGDRWCFSLGHQLRIATIGIKGITIEEAYDAQSIITDIFIGYAENIWIGTNNRGLKKITCLRIAMQQVWENTPKATFSIKKSSYADIFLVGGDGFFSKLVTNQSEISKSNVSSELLESTIVWDSAVDPINQNKVWLATEDGLYYTTSDAPPVKYSSPANLLMNPNRVLLVRNSEIWVGTISGLFKIKDGAVVEILKNDGSRFGYVYTLSLVDEARIWIGTLGSGLWIENEDDSFALFTNDIIKSNANTYAIAPHVSGNILIIQENRVMLLNKDLKARLVLMENPVAGWSAVWINDHLVAIGSNNGIVLLDVNLAKITQRINPLLGKAAWQFTSSRSLFFDGINKLYCGINSGLYIIDLEKFQQFNEPPTLYLEDVNWENANPTSDGYHFKVAAKKWSVNITVFADYLIDENQIGYRFKLVGFEENWSKLSHRPRVRFNSLPVGRYELLGQVYLPLSGDGPVTSLLTINVTVPFWSKALKPFATVGGSLNERFFKSSSRNKKLLARNLELEREVDERKRAVSELARYRKHLEEIVDHRTHELTQQKERAESADRMKSVFLATMSHEIRTPMNAIIGFTNLLLQGQSPSEQQESYELLKFSGDHLLAILNDVLDLSKIEAGKIDLEMSNFNLNRLVSNVVKLFQVKSDEKGIALTYKFDPSLSDFVKGDPVRIGQIITNLISNAVKFTERGFVEMTVSRGEMPSSYHFRVKDSGIGFETKKIDSLFESFTQANTDTTRKYGGTGLGLTITKKLVNLMGSEIKVESTPDIGSIFSFKLTLAEGVQVLDVEDRRTANIEFPVGTHILLVEDNMVNQMVASRQLDKWGITYEIANHGIEALDLVKQKTFDLVLMDLQMSEMDGYEACRIIRTLDGDYYLKIPIIALTASVSGMVRNKVKTAGMNDYILKPFEPSVFREMLLSYIVHEKT